MRRTAASVDADSVPPDAILKKLRVPFVRRGVLQHGHGEEAVFLVDLGLRGVFVERMEPLPVGEPVEIKFLLPGNEIPIRTACRVAWWHATDAPLVSKTLPAGLGLQFVRMAGPDLARLRAHLVEYCRRHPKTRHFGRPWPSDDEEDH